jgi:alpha-L-fucosidase
MTTNNNWGYHPDDTNYKTPFEIISIFADAISNGGNLLLDIGPKEDGTIPAEQVHILRELGKWNKKHAEAIFGTLAGLPQGHFYGPSTISKDSTVIYLFLTGQNTGNIMLKGLVNKINDIQILGTSKHLEAKVVGKISWSPIPGLVFINVPQKYKDPYITVLKVKLDKPMQLYRGKGGLN